jgi:hypothetical protein
MSNTKGKCMVLVLNCASQNSDTAYFLLQDDDENTRVFDSRYEAKQWIEDNGDNYYGPWAYSIIEIDDLEYE